MKKELYKNYFKSLLKSKIRFKLTIIGMTISFFLIFCCVIVVNTFENHIKSNYKSFGNDVLVIKSENELTQEKMNLINNNFNDSRVSYYTSSYVTTKVYNEMELYYNIQGVSRNFIDNYMFSLGHYGNNIDDIPILEKRNILLGHTWTKENIINKSRVVVISELTAMVLFNEKNPINEYIELNDYYYKIVGVVSNSYVTNEYILNQKKVESMLLEFYMPKTTFNCYFNDSQYNIAVINDNNEKINQFENYYNTLSFDDELYSRNVLDKAISNILNSTITITTIATIFISFISIIILLNTMFFNVKEKIPEYGIRMALGASNKDIRKQIIFDGFIQSLISINISIILVIIFYLLLQIIFINCNFFVKEIYINPITFIITVIIMFFSSINLSIIPIIYIRKINIIDSIKFD